MVLYRWDRVRHSRLPLRGDPGRGAQSSPVNSRRAVQKRTPTAVGTFHGERVGKTASHGPALDGGCLSDFTHRRAHAIISS